MNVPKYIPKSIDSAKVSKVSKVSIPQYPRLFFGKSKKKKEKTWRWGNKVIKIIKFDARRNTFLRLLSTKVVIGPNPLMASGSRITVQSKEALLKSYNARLKDDVRSMLENFEEILKLARRDTHSQISKITQCEQDALEMQVRAANMVRAGESLMKLVADLKQYLILNDFHSVNEAITNNSQLFRATQIECDKKLMKLRDEMAMDLYDLEEEYYTSIFK